MLSVLCDHLPGLTLGPIQQKLFEDEWSKGCMVKDYWVEKYSVTDFTAGAWDWEKEPSSKEWPGKGEILRSGRREVSFIFPMPPRPMCPKETRMTVLYKVTAYSSGEPTGIQSVKIESSSVSHDIPYGDYFRVQEQIDLESQANGMLVTKSFAADFAKQTFLKSTIASSVEAAQQEACDKLMDVLRSCAEFTTSVQSDTSSNGSNYMQLESADSAGEESCEPEGEPDAGVVLEEDDVHIELSTADHLENEVTVEVWEVQRRTTIFHKNWRAPFLPTDGERRARWVNSSHQRHPWIIQTWMDAAASEVPPLEAPAAMRPSATGFEVVNAPPGAPSDQDGWQYGAAFYKSDHRWGTSVVGASCRRRLWRCSFLRVPVLETTREVTVDLWELQRRTTIFQSDWRSPFLPHDKLKKHFRWVNKDFRPHSWCIPDAEVSDGTPPVKIPEGWSPEGWFVVYVDPCDSVRWQYASDFYHSDRHWGGSSIGQSCRRRLWRCRFTEGCKASL